MPRTIQLHPLSLLAGVGFALLGVVAMGQMPAGPHARYSPPTVAATVTPSSWLQIREGTGFLVPSGMVFVPTAIGTDRENNDIASLYFDGVKQAGVAANYGDYSMIPMPVGQRASAGTLVTVDAPTPANLGQAWGYLHSATGAAPKHSGPGPVADWVIIEEGVPFSVPQGRVLAITAVGSLATYARSTVSVDGLIQASINAAVGFTSLPGPTDIPMGLTAPAGSLVQANDLAPGNDARAWGYLVDA
jgi:hypothetical protein